MDESLLAFTLVFFNYFQFIRYGFIAIVLFEGIKRIITKKEVPILEIVCFVVGLALGFYYVYSMQEVLTTSNLAIIILILISYVLSQGILISIFLIFHIRNERIYRCKTNSIRNQLKNDSADFFLQVNKNNKIVDYSKSIYDLTHYTIKQIKKLSFLDLLFKHFNITKINDSVLSDEVKSAFNIKLIDAIKERDTFTFKIDCAKSDSFVYYTVLGMPMYHKNIFIGVNYFFYEDKMKLISRVKDSLSLMTESLEKYKESLNILMTLSEGIALYYDFQEHVYYATDAFMEYMGDNKKEYTFQEILEFIHEEDRDKYFEETKYINSRNVSRMKYRFVLNGEVFNVIEDSIYLNSQTNDLASIIHITSKEGMDMNNHTLSTKETVDMLNNLSNVSITPVLEKTLEIFEKARMIKNEK